MRMRPLMGLMALLAAGCTVGPDYEAPEAHAPGSWRDLQRSAHTRDDKRAPHAGAPSVADTRSDPDPRWWVAFNDATLNSLVDRAVAGNLSLQSAVLRITTARQQAIQAGAQGLPRVGANASATRQQLGVKGFLEANDVYGGIDALGAPDSSLNQFQPGLGGQAQSAVRSGLDQVTAPITLYQDGFDASWELDLFGRVRRSVESAQAQVQAEVESRNDALVSLEAEVAQTYSQLRGAQTLRQITLDQIEDGQRILDLTREQARGGLTSHADVQSATAQVGALQAQLPQFDAQISQAMNGLAVLTGQPPGALDAELDNPQAVPPVPPTVPVGLPATLARRRPDIRRAEARLHAATAEQGVAIAQLYPDISLSGEIGTRSSKARYLSHWSSLFWSIGPSISLPIFEGGALRANVRIAKAQAQDAALQYRQAVLNALQEVENALVHYRSDQDQREALARTVQANQESLRLATDS